MLKKQLRQIYTPRVIGVSPSTPLHEAVSLMRTHSISCIPVLEDGRPVGIFTERDIVRTAKVHSGNHSRLPMSEVMSSPVISAQESLHNFEAYNLMQRNRLRHLIVVDLQGRAVGVVSQTNLIDHMGIKYFVQIRKVGQIMIKSLTTVPPTHSVEDVLSLMIERRISCVIITRTNKALGIITERDVARLLSEDVDIAHVPIKDVMSSPVLAIEMNDSVQKAMEHIRRNKVRRLTVVNKQGELRGLITQSDIVNSLEGDYVDLLKEIIEEKEAQYESIFENSVLGIFRSTLEGYILAANPGLARMLGYDSPEELQLEINTGLHTFALNSSLWEELVASTKNSQVYKTESMFLRKDGTTVIGQIVVRRVEDNDSEAIYLDGFIEDITERKRMEEELKASKEAAEQANQAKSEFLANMSHELRNPISGILGVTQMVLSSDLKSSQKENIELIKDSATSLLTILDSILDLSKIEAHRMDFNLVDFDLHDSLQRIIRTYKTQAKNKGLDLELTIEKDVPRQVNGDPEKLEQVIRNLISNSLKFTEKGSLSLHAEKVPGSGPEQELRFDVRDTGTGIPEDKLDDIFQKFCQLDSSYSKKYGGAGLGLTISKQLVELMGGTIWVESRPGEGSCFSFTARFAPATGPTQVPAKTKGTSPPAANLRPLEILLAEDNVVNQKFLDHFLRKAGHTVTTVTNGLEVLRALQDGSYDVVLMDVQMPEMDGIAATKSIRSASGGHINSKVPIIALTAYSMKGDRERFLEAGMDDYISKPVDMNELFSSIQQVITTQ